MEAPTHIGANEAPLPTTTELYYIFGVFYITLVEHFNAMRSIVRTKFDILITREVFFLPYKAFSIYEAFYYSR
jgi:hypothetical protein